MFLFSIIKINILTNNSKYIILIKWFSRLPHLPSKIGNKHKGIPCCIPNQSSHHLVNNEQVAYTTQTYIFQWVLYLEKTIQMLSINSLLQLQHIECLYDRSLDVHATNCIACINTDVNEETDITIFSMCSSVNRLCNSSCVQFIIRGAKWTFGCSCEVDKQRYSMKLLQPQLNS
jgi:hypothetical protein